MGKRFKVYLIRIFAVVVVVAMIATTFSSLFSNVFNSSEDTTTETSKYKYVDEDNEITLDGVSQTILLPSNMELQDTETNDELNAVQENYGTATYDNITFAIVVTKLESENGGNVEDLGMVTKSEMSEQSQSIESEDVGYYSFMGEENDYMEKIQLIPSDTSNFSYMLAYSIFDLEGNNYYMVALYMTSPTSPSKSDMKKLENIGKEMMSSTKYSKYTVTSEFAVPGELEDLFNH